MTKPPYRVPSMAEIAAIPPNGFVVASFFAGAGGSCLGYRMAGFRVAYANEFAESARASHAANDPDCHLDPRDIRTVRPEEVLEAIGLEAGQLDVMDGSPPCRSFSMAGKRSAGWGKKKEYKHTSQREEDLFFEYARLLRGIRPKVFVAENVSGLVKGTAKGYFLEILCELKASGYRVAAKLLDAQWLGVPQSRQRLIFVGVRKDLARDTAFPKPLPYRYSVREALPWIHSLPTLLLAGQQGRQSSDLPSPTVTTSDVGGSSANYVEAEVIVDDGKGYSGLRRGNVADLPMMTIRASRRFRVEIRPEPESDMRAYAVGREWAKLRPGEKSGKYMNLVRASLDKPSETATTRGGRGVAASVAHPTECRKFSIAELRRICGFPDDFVLLGSYADQWRCLGNAVPPVMMRAIASVVRDEILTESLPER